MRLGLVIYNSLDSISGGYIYDRKLVEHLRSEGDVVRLFSIPWRSYPRHLMDNLSTSWLAEFTRARLDLLLQDELNHPSLFFLNRRLRPRIQHPIIAIVHHLRSREHWPLPVRTLYRAVERRYLASVDAFIFNSQATRLSVEDLLGHDRPGVIAHPGGDRLAPPLDDEEILTRARQRGPLRLAFVGNLIPRKGLHRLLVGLAALKKESWELSVVGCVTLETPYVRKIRGIIAETGLDSKVRFLGSLPDAGLARLLRKSDILAMPFSYEGFGIVYLEGMAQGLPALACRSGGAGEIVVDGENGYLFEPENVTGLIGVLRRLIRDRGELARLSLAARRRFEAFPTWEQTAAKIRSFLRESVRKISRNR